MQKKISMISSFWTGSCLKKMASQSYIQYEKKGIHTPVIMVTALGALQDKVKGFENGADDYLVKPFAMEELLMRIRALLRRPASMIDSDALSYGDISLNRSQMKLECNQQECSLSKKEAQLFELFMQNKEQVLTREIILERVWGPESDVTTGNLDNFISFLRRRLRTVNSNCKLTTIHGIGYRLETNQ